ncbi:MAG: hypothetical protein IJZ96_08105 [Lachnospiraceae bacterium]|nr:hypothetical protein [Lachnospiraceae bacterium]
MVVVWQTKGSIEPGLDIAIRWIVLPLLLLVSTITVAENNYWGKGKWLCVIVAAVTFLAVPYTSFMECRETGTLTFTFRFPNFSYMLVGIIISVLGIVVGTFLNKKKM